jgi:hypothetical protein
MRLFIDISSEIKMIKFSEKLIPMERQRAFAFLLGEKAKNQS